MTEIMLNPPYRICFNFTKRCNMSCKFCYIPFDNKLDNLDTWIRIVDRISHLGSSVVTFGGGDPLMYPEFRTVLRRAKNHGLLVHVDTNGLRLNESDYDLIRENVDLLGLPLDGATAATHEAMRGNARHFDIVQDVIKRISDTGVPIKINTVVAKPNLSEIIDLSFLVDRSGAKRWSIYRFWPIGSIARENADRFAISELEFSIAASNARKNLSNVKLEIGDVDERRKTYFFVSSSGLSYTIDPNNSTAYVKFGTIFDEDIISKWGSLADPTLNARRARARFSR